MLTALNTDKSLANGLDYAVMIGMTGVSTPETSLLSSADALNKRKLIQQLEAKVPPLAKELMYVFIVCFH